MSNESSFVDPYDTIDLINVTASENLNLNDIKNQQERQKCDTQKSRICAKQAEGLKLSRIIYYPSGVVVELQ